MDSLAASIAMVLLTSCLSAVGGGVLAAFTVGAKIAGKHTDKINNHSVKIAELEVRVTNGVSLSLQEIKQDIKTLMDEALSRPCQKHTYLLDALMTRIEKLEQVE